MNEIRFVRNICNNESERHCAHCRGGIFPQSYRKHFAELLSLPFSVFSVEQEFAVTVFEALSKAVGLRLPPYPPHGEGNPKQGGNSSRKKDFCLCQSCEQLLQDLYVAHVRFFQENSFILKNSILTRGNVSIFAEKETQTGFEDETETVKLEVEILEQQHSHVSHDNIDDSPENLQGFADESLESPPFAGPDTEIPCSSNFASPSSSTLKNEYEIGRIPDPDSIQTSIAEAEGEIFIKSEPEPLEPPEDSFATGTFVNHSENHNSQLELGQFLEMPINSTRQSQDSSRNSSQKQMLPSTQKISTGAASETVVNSNATTTTGLPISTRRPARVKRTIKMANCELAESDSNEDKEDRDVDVDTKSQPHHSPASPDQEPPSVGAEPDSDPTFPILKHKRKRPDPEPEPICEKLYPSVLVVSHDGGRTVTPKRVCPEPGCGKLFMTSSRLEIHRDRYHVFIKPPLEKECRVLGCGKIFENQRDLRVHQIRHHGAKKPHSCPICNKSFTTSREVHLHENVHNNVEKKFKCPEPECGKFFKLQEYLDSHRQRIHPLDRPYTCYICKSRFAAKQDLRDHLRTHREKDFLCQECGATFRTACQLKAHSTVHSEDRPFKCNNCGKSYKSKAHLYGHRQITHTEDRPFVCDVCGKAFKTNGDLNYHKIQHENKRKYKCPAPGCTSGFNYGHGLVSHLHLIHKLDKEQVRKWRKNPTTVTLLFN